MRGGGATRPASAPSLPPGAERVGVRWGIPERLPLPTSPSHRSAMGPSLSPLKGGEGKSRCRFGAALVAALAIAGAPGAHGEEVVALYQAYWAGVPAGEIRLKLRDDPANYRDEITVRSQGLPWLLTHFRATAVSEGRLAADRPPEPARYNALYDLRKGRDRRLSMSFAGRGGAAVAERGAGDTSKKPLLAEAFRKNVLDPLSHV